MTASIALLREYGDHIAAMAAELHDVGELEADIRAFVRELADHLESGRPFQAPDWPGIDKTLLAKILRSLFFDATEVFRPRMDSQALAEAVIGLRKALHDLVPRPSADPDDREFYRRLLLNDAEGLAPEHGRLMGLFEDFSLNIREIVYVHDLNGTFLYMNQPGLQLTRYTLDDLLAGLSIYDLIVPEYADLIEAKMESPGSITRAPYTSEIYTRDGERIPIEITTRVLCRDRQPRGIVGLAVDLRLARRLEEEINRANRYCDGIVSNAPLGIVLTDAQLITLDANPAAVALFGAPGAHALLGMPFYRLCEGDVSPLYRVLADTVEKEQPGWFPCDQPTTFGARLCCELTLAPLRLTSVCVDHLLILMHDVGSHEMLRQQLDHALWACALGDSIPALARDLQSSLAGLLEQVKRIGQTGVPPAVESGLEAIGAAATRCDGSLRRLLELARRGSGEQTLHDVNDMVREALRQHDPMFRGDGIEVELALDSGLPRVLVNRAEMERALASLTRNAREAINARATGAKALSVETYARDGYVHVRFADASPGPARAGSTRLFEPFWGAGAEGPPDLALGAAYGVIRNHGGRIACAPGEGAGQDVLVTVALPIPGTPAHNRTPR